MRILFCSLLVVVHSFHPLFAQEYIRNRNSKLILFDSELKEVKPKTSSGLEMDRFPYSYTKTKSEKYFDLYLDKKQDKKATIETAFVKNVFVTDGLKNCTTCPIKFAGKRHDYLEEDVYVNYTKKKPMPSDKVNLRLLEPEFKIKQGTFLGQRLGTDVKAAGESQMYDPVLGSKTNFVKSMYSFFKESSTSYIRGKVFDNKLQKIEAANSYLCLSPQVEILHFNLYRNLYNSEEDNPDKNGTIRYFGTGDVLIEWRFIRPNGEKAFGITTRVVASAKAPDPHSLFEFLVEQSLESLLASDSLYEKLSKANKLLSDKSSPTKLVLPKKDKGTIESSKSLIRTVTPSVVTVYGDNSGHFGSGFFVSASGYVLTNYHVIKGETQLKVLLHKDTTRYDAEIVKIEEDIDLAVLKIKKENTPYLQLANSDEVEIGETVFAIGTPGDKKLAQSVTRGIVSGRREFDDKNYFQTDVSVNRGNSGGPLINESGEAIGIVVMKVVGDGIEGLSFVIPSNIAMQKLGLEYK